MSPNAYTMDGRTHTNIQHASLLQSTIKIEFVTTFPWSSIVYVCFRSIRCAHTHNTHTMAHIEWTVYKIQIRIGNVNKYANTSKSPFFYCVRLWTARLIDNTCLKGLHQTCNKLSFGYKSMLHTVCCSNQMNIMLFAFKQIYIYRVVRMNWWKRQHRVKFFKIFKMRWQLNEICLAYNCV